MNQEETYNPQHLGKSSSDPIDQVDLIPWKGQPITVTLKCTEFTSLCPVTGQPDFGELIISYQPDQHIIETKSMKLYLTRFRDQGVFSEALVNTIANDLWRQASPRYLSVKGLFKSRGGISIEVEAIRPLES
jgi:7-cyano-7-deazaguanine reductase